MDPEYKQFSEWIAQYFQEKALVNDPPRCLMLMGVAYFNLCQALRRDPYASMAEIVNEFTKDFERRLKEEGQEESPK